MRAQYLRLRAFDDLEDGQLFVEAEIEFMNRLPCEIEHFSNRFRRQSIVHDDGHVRQQVVVVGSLAKKLPRECLNENKPFVINR